MDYLIRKTRAIGDLVCALSWVLAVLIWQGVKVRLGGSPTARKLVRVVVVVAVLALLTAGVYQIRRCMPKRPVTQSEPVALATFKTGEVTQEMLDARLLEIRGALDLGNAVPGILCPIESNRLGEEITREIADEFLRATELILKDLALEETLLRSAVEHGLMSDLSYLRQIWEYETTLLVDNVEDALRGEAHVTESEAREYFLGNREEYAVPETVSLRHVFVNMDFLDTPVVRTKEQSKKLIEQVRDSLKEGEAFSILVHKYSDSDSASRGGRIGPVSQGSMDSVIEREIFSLEVGQVSSCIETYSGFHLFILDNRTSASSPQWEQIKDRVISQIEEEHYGELLQETKEDILKSADVTNNLDKLVLMSKPNDLLFRVGETRFTVDDYLYLFPQSRPEMVSAVAGVERFDKDVLREVFERALLAEAARRRGYLDVPEIRKQLERKSRQLLIDLQFQSICSDHFKDIVSDESQLRSFYQKEKESFRTDLRVIVDRITLSPAVVQGDESLQAQQQAVKRLNKQVSEVFELLRSGASASELSKHGVQQWRSSESPQEIAHFEPEIQDPLRSKANTLLDSPPGKDALPDPRVMEPVRVADQFVILRVREVFPSRLKTFEEVRHEIEGRILETRQQDVALQQAMEILREIEFQPHHN